MEIHKRLESCQRRVLHYTAPLYLYPGILCPPKTSGDHVGGEVRHTGLWYSLVLAFRPEMGDTQAVELGLSHLGSVISPTASLFPALAWAKGQFLRMKPHV